MDNIYSPKECGKLIGRITNTLQKWDREGKLSTHRNSITNRRYHTHDQYLIYRGLAASEQSLTIAYAKVSGVAQKSDLANQVKTLEIYRQDHHIQVDESPEQELVQGLIAIVTVFSARLYELDRTGKCSKTWLAERGIA